MLLDQNELIENIKIALDENTKDVVISSAYIKTELLKELQSSLHDKNVSIYVRWEIDDLIKGVSDLGIYELCAENNWKLYRHHRLHAKFILIDRTFLILGSSNYTLSGTGRNRNNIERNFMTQIDESSCSKLLKDYSFSTRITESIFTQLQEFIKENSFEREYPDYEFDEVIFSEDSEKFSPTSFTYDQLPPFRPDDNSFDKNDNTHNAFLKDHGIISYHDFEALRNFIETNPVSQLVTTYLSSYNNQRCQWGKVEQLIMADDTLFGLAGNDRQKLKMELGENNRLFNLFCWLEYFEPTKYEVWKRLEYLNDPRVGTCSLNLI